MKARALCTIVLGTPKDPRTVGKGEIFESSLAGELIQAGHAESVAEDPAPKKGKKAESVAEDPAPKDGEA